MTIAEHLIATTRDRASDLATYAQAAWLWPRLMAAIPDAFSLVLMPDHLHMMAPEGRGPKLRGVLSGFSRRFGVRLDLRPSERATTHAIAARQVRYGFNNPVRGKLVEDPWMWPWSTLRDLGGVAVPRWTRLADVAMALSSTPEGLLRLVCSSSLGVHPPPRLAPPKAAPVDKVIDAAAAALRVPPSSIPESRRGRRLVAHVCQALAEAPSRRVVADALGIDPSSVNRLRRQDEPATAAVLACLADPRLTRFLPK